MGDIVDKYTKITLSMFDDPLLANDETVRAKRPDVLALTNAVAEALQKLSEIETTVRTGLDTAKVDVAQAASKKAAEAQDLAKKSADANKAAEVVIPPVHRRSPNASTTAGQPSSSGSNDQQRKLELQAALAKPINERNGEELVLTGRAGKSRKTARAADDMELANV